MVSHNAVGQSTAYQGRWSTRRKIPHLSASTQWSKDKLLGVPQNVIIASSRMPARLFKRLSRTNVVQSVVEGRTHQFEISGLENMGEAGAEVVWPG